jgi:uncharacterized Zn-binding protein involved in type VI secretion
MAGAVRLGDKAKVQIDAHGCPACPHPGIGPAIAGSPDVNVNKRPAIRLDDPGLHMACCGPNTWNAMQGSMTVFINNKPAVRIGDQTRHCGGIGSTVEGSQNVIVGGPPGMGSSGGGGGGGGGGGAGGGGGSSGGGGGGSSGGGGSGGSGSTSSTGSTGGSGSQGARGGAASSSSAAGAGPGDAASQDGKNPDDQHVYVVAADLKTPGGQPLGFEQVVLVKQATSQGTGQTTEEQVAGPETTDDQGHVAFVVPEQGDYQLKVVEDEQPHPAAHIDEDHVTFELQCQFFDDGIPVAGETVEIRGPGGSQTITLGPGGQLTLDVAPGEYELAIRKQTFKANAVRAADAAGGHEFQLDNALDQVADFTAARANRYSPSNRGES